MLLETLRRFAYPPACPGCGAAVPDDLLCAPCSRRVPFRGSATAEPPADVQFLWAPCRYEGVVRDLLTRLKYGGERHPCGALSALLGVVLPEVEDVARPDCVVPVPIAFGRLRRRGFNQAELLAEPVARALGVPLLRALRKRGRRPPQASLGREERLRNLADGFAPKDGLFGRAVLLLDDVVTTGATLAAAAAALREGGARRVAALVVARTD